jgi:Ca2+-binding EF-hand superfamily protein
MNKKNLELLFTKLTKKAGQTKIDFQLFLSALKTITQGDEPDDLEALLTCYEKNEK